MQPATIPVEAAPPPADVSEAHAEVLADPSLQFDFQGQTPPQLPDWLEPLLRLIGLVAPYLQWIFWGLVAAGALLIVWLVAREVVKVRFGTGAHGERPELGPEVWRPTEQAARAVLADADALAARGRYAEAVHLILLRSIADLMDRRPNVVRPALTARDIGRLDALPAAARPAFSRIAVAVEAGRFAGRPVAAEDFAACRRDYEAFALPDGWRR